MSGHTSVRLLPVVIAAMAALAILKAAGLMLLDDTSLSPISPATAQDAGADANGGATAAPGRNGTAGPAMADSEQSGSPASAPTLTESERAVLESLRVRREELETRDQDLLMRENLLQATEQRLDAKIKELKAMEARIQASIKDKEEADDQQFAGLVSMYESMKPKAAARIFDRMDVEVVVGVARRMNPELLAKVLAQMDPASAERVTIEIAQISVEGTGFANELDAIAPQ